VVRAYEPSDAEGAGALLAEHSPWFWTAAGLQHRLDALPDRARRATWVADVDEAIVGYSEAEFDWASDVEGVGRVYVLVAPPYRRRGLGSELFERGVEHLLANGARELRSWSFPESDDFLRSRSFRPTRTERVSAVDPRTVDTSALSSLPDGVRIAPLAELDDRLPDVHALYAEAAADMPADHAESNIDYNEWLVETIRNPELSREGSMVVLVDDRPASLSWLLVDPQRGLAEHDLTGTARAHRRRGLARLAKLAAMRWAAENGVTRVTTGNDETNAGMLAINDAIGFRPFAVETEWVKPVE
jgi:GNAT superfamily N-acetyltransferase